MNAVFVLKIIYKAANGVVFLKISNQQAAISSAEVSKAITLAVKMANDYEIP